MPSSVSPFQLIVKELGFTDGHLTRLRIIGVSTSDSSEHVELLSDATRHGTEPERKKGNVLERDRAAVSEMCDRRRFIPPLLYRAECGPLLGFRVIAFDRVINLPVRASSHQIELLLHGSTATELWRAQHQ